MRNRTDVNKIRAVVSRYCHEIVKCIQMEKAYYKLQVQYLITVVCPAEPV